MVNGFKLWLEARCSPHNFCVGQRVIVYIPGDEHAAIGRIEELDPNGYRVRIMGGLIDQAHFGWEEDLWVNFDEVIPYTRRNARRFVLD